MHLLKSWSACRERAAPRTDEADHKRWDTHSGIPTRALVTTSLQIVSRHEDAAPAVAEGEMIAG